jgi:hypothetical protein
MIMPKTTKTTKKANATREAWLQRGAEILTRTVFRDAAIAVPKVRTSCSWPGGGSARTRVGECWPSKMSAAGVNEIFISPRIEDAIQALDILAHELVHASDDCASGHGAEFVRRARAIGLEGKPTATVAGAALRARLEHIAADLGAYPHARLDLSSRKKQTTRMIKVTCCDEDCAGVFRCARSHIEKARNNLSCPFCGGEEVEIQGGENG